MPTLDLQSTDALEVPGISKLLRRAVRNLLEKRAPLQPGRHHAGAGAPGRHGRDPRLRPWPRRGAGPPRAHLREVLSPARRSERSGGVGLGWPWCAPSPSATAAACTAKAAPTASRAPASCCGCRWPELPPAAQPRRCCHSTRSTRSLSRSKCQRVRLSRAAVARAGKR